MKLLTKNLVSLSISDMGSRLIQLGAFAYLAQRLGSHSMGLLAIGFAVLSYTTIITNAGLPILGTRAIAKGETDQSSLIKNIITSRFLLSLITIVAAIWVLPYLVKDSGLETIIIIYILFLLPHSFFLEWYFQGKNRMTILSANRLIGSAVYLLFIVLIVKTTDQIKMVPIGWIIGGIIQALIMGLYCFTSVKPIPYNGQPNNSNWQLIKKGIPLGIANLISQCVIQFPFIYLGFFDSVHSTGIYSIAFRIVVFLLIIDRVFYTVFFPLITKSIKKSFTDASYHLDISLKVVSCAVLYLSVLCIIIAPRFIPVIFGSEFQLSSQVFQYLMIYFILSVINTIFTSALIASNDEKTYTWSLLWGAISAFIFLIVPLHLPLLKVIPLSLGVFQAVSMLIMLQKLHKALSVRLFRRFGVPLISVFIIHTITNTLQLGDSILFLLSVVLVLPFLLAFASGFNKNDILFLKKQLV